MESVFVSAKLGNQYSLNLRKVAIPVVNHAGCKLRFGMSYNAKQHLCGGDWYNGNQDSCQVKFHFFKKIPPQS